MNILQTLPPFNSKTGNLNVVIDTPKGCRNKYAFDFKHNTYVLKTMLPRGAVFPFDFGSVAGTKAEDGDPLDALVLMDEPAFTGCLIEARLIGVIKAKQTEDGKTERNDRLVAVAAESPVHKKIKTLTDIQPTVLKEIEHFFVSYNHEKGKKFKPLSHAGPKKAQRLVRKWTKKVK
jgi:inorganic pyrophosphatase